ncbi:MAG: hypothetical protein HeimC3_03270 [Candidatus Heimdallarchaeota archaeon LC_3]|nr:MAG: hypothetical protein HeimC3_03270 [Candidatus Heimdallarchaeota archaeon LC_3]
MKNDQNSENFEELVNTIQLTPKNLIKLFNVNGYEILNSLSSSPKTVKELSKEMRLSEQAVYYHIKKLLNLEIITYQEEIEKLPSTTVKIHRYSLVSDKIIIDMFPGSNSSNSYFHKAVSGINTRIPKFLRFIAPKKSIIEGFLVVGSAIIHGKYNATAQDGHYVGYIGFLLGQLGLQYRKNFSFVKLDTEINRENLQNTNMIVIGGPKVNVITSELQDNDFLPITFEISKINTITNKKVKKSITDPLIGVIQLIANPWSHSKKKKILLLCGPSRIGTQIAVYAITHFSDKIDEKLTKNKEFVLLQGILDNKEDIIDISFSKYP